MNAVITDRDYLNAAKFREYDSVVSNCMSYMWHIAEINDGRIVLSFSKGIDDEESKYLFKIAKLCNTVNSIPIYLNLNLIDYLRFKSKNKTNYTVKKLIKKRNYIDLTPENLKGFINSSKKVTYDNTIFYDIWNEFWTDNEKEEEETDV